MHVIAISVPAQPVRGFAPGPPHWAHAWWHGRSRHRPGSQSMIHQGAWPDTGRDAAGDRSVVAQAGPEKGRRRRRRLQVRLGRANKVSG